MEETPTSVLGTSMAAPVAPTNEPQTPSTVMDGWMKGADMEYANDPSIKAIQDVPSLVKSYVHAQRMIGKDRAVIPDKNSDPQQWKEFYSKIGLPSKVEEYQLEKIENGVFDESFGPEFAKFAYENNILPAQANGVMKYMSDALSQHEQMLAEQKETEVKANIGELQKEWGSGFEKNLSKAQQVIKLFAGGDEDLKKYLTDPNTLGNDTKFIKFLAKVGESLKEDTFSSEAVGHLGMTKTEADRKIQSIYGDTNHPYNNPQHPAHKNAILEMQKLFEVTVS